MLNSIQTPALVTRPAKHASEPSQYLMLNSNGGPVWTEDPKAATTFVSMREATRAALRLPSRFRAYSLPHLAG